MEGGGSMLKILVSTSMVVVEKYLVSDKIFSVIKYLYIYVYI